MPAPAGGRHSPVVTQEAQLASKAIKKPLNQKELPFTIDAALLRELGERLVGRPHIALAELIKNSYDADARNVRVTLDPDQIIIEDDGHGMTLPEFRDFWMRIGTPHKQAEGVSRHLQRPLTGSKGIGRLAVQFLGRQLQLDTTSDSTTTRLLVATVDWNKAVRSHELTSATASYTQQRRRDQFIEDDHGTRIIVSGLNNSWAEDDIKELALELWMLQPPFGSQDKNDPRSFKVTLVSTDRDYQEIFAQQISANLDIWSAKLNGTLRSSRMNARKKSSFLQVGLAFRNGPAERQQFEIPNCLLNDVSFDIRIFTLHGRQRFGIALNSQKQYLKEFGGVHVYDAGFHLPYYGPDADWLSIEMTHSHRLSRSKLLPESLQVPGGMSNLPTSSRIYGVVRIDTARERSAAQADSNVKTGNYLEIQASRDRLVDNPAFKQLIDVVRRALDFYAMRYTALKYERETQERFQHSEVLSTTLRDVDGILESHKAEIPEKAYEPLRASLKAAIDQERVERRAASADLGLMGSLATAGISAIALEHESGKQISLLQNIARELKAFDVKRPDAAQRLQTIANQLIEWLERTKSMRSLFSPLLEDEDRRVQARLKANIVIDTIVQQTATLTRGIKFDTNHIDKNLVLPSATIAEWNAIFQNVILNATNALLDSSNRLIKISSTSSRSRRSILVQDNGSGIDLSKADKYFSPFIRDSQISAERRQLGLGGTGLGLTIVRMVASNLKCDVAFVTPEAGFNTAFELSWHEES